MSDIGIVGMGVVGSALAYGFRKGHKIKTYDKFKESDTLEEVCKESEFIFICLPSPANFNIQKIDLSVIDENLKEITNYVKGTNKIVIIKSTVVPGTTLKYSEQYPDVLFCFNPEFLKEASYLEDFVNADRTIIGANNFTVANRLTVLYKDQFPKIPIYRTDFTTAEMTKYMSNTLLFSIVIHNNIIYDICEALKISYPEVAKFVSKDNRFKDLNYFEVTSNRGAGQKCLPKDLISLIGKGRELNVDVSFLEKIWSENLRLRKNRDWENIPGAVIKKNY